jgi:LytR cell envelope-related transcriptional attenuator
MEQGWRKATIAVTVFAALEFVVLVGAGVAILGNPLASHLQTQSAKAANRPTRPGPVHAPSHAILPRHQVSVMVLNGNGAAGAAAAAAARVQHKGYLVGSVGNAARPDYARTVVMYRPGFQAEGARLAHDLHVRVVSPLDGIKPRQLMGSHLVLLLGTAR